MSAMLREAGLLKELAEAKERIRQIEAEKVPLADVAKATQLLKNERDDEAYELLVKVLAAAPAQEKGATYAGPSSTACDDQLSAGAGEDM